MRFLFKETDSSLLIVYDSDDPNSFSRRLVERLLRKLEQERLPHLSEAEQAHLIVMIQTTLEVCLYTPLIIII